MSEYWEVPKRRFSADAVNASSKNVGPTVNAASNHLVENGMAWPISARERPTAT